MKNIIHKLLPVFVLTTFVLSACSTAVPAAETKVETPDKMAQTELMSEPATVTNPATPEAEMPKEEVSQAWLGSQFTNVATGETFSISDFKGKIVLVEMFATWCPTCKRQQNEVKLVLGELGDTVAAVGLGVDPNESTDLLAKYIGNNGFDWTYAVAPAEVVREIANLFGGAYINPPSAPIILVDADGIPHPLPVGIKTADDLKQSISEFSK